MSITAQLSTHLPGGHHFVEIGEEFYTRITDDVRSLLLDHQGATHSYLDSMYDRLESLLRGPPVDSADLPTSPRLSLQRTPTMKRCKVGLKASPTLVEIDAIGLELVKKKQDDIDEAAAVESVLQQNGPISEVQDAPCKSMPASEGVAAGGTCTNTVIFADSCEEVPLQPSRSADSATSCNMDTDNSVATMRSKSENLMMQATQTASKWLGQSTSMGTNSTSSMPQETHDAKVHWRRHIRKKYARKRHFEPLSKESQRIMVENMSTLSKFIKSKPYELCVMLLVLLNAAFIGWQVQHFATHHQVLDVHRDFEVVFCIFFVLELCLRIAAEGTKFFTHRAELSWNLFDVCVVTMMLFEEILNSFGAAENSLLSQISMLRVLRVVRVVRVLRIIRVLKFFRELRLMVHSILNSIKSLTWAMLVLCMMFYIFGISLTQGVVDYLQKEDKWHDPNTEQLQMYFGTLDGSLPTLYEAMCGGLNWGEPLKELKPLHYTYKAIYILFISSALFAVVNIVTGIFVETAMQSSLHDREVLIQEQLRANEAYLDQMHTIFQEIDNDGDGSLELDEFRRAIKDERVMAYFNALGLDITDVQTLFLLLDRDQQGLIDIEEFLIGCMRLKGEARSLDVAKLQMDCEWMIHNLETMKLQLNVISGKGEEAVRTHGWETGSDEDFSDSDEKDEESEEIKRTISKGDQKLAFSEGLTNDARPMPGDAALLGLPG